MMKSDLTIRAPFDFIEREIIQIIKDNKLQPLIEDGVSDPLATVDEIAFIFKHLGIDNAAISSDSLKINQPQFQASLDRLNVLRKNGVELIKNGHVELFNRLSAHPYIISGTVLHGKKLGRRLSFPTLNIETSKKIIPPAGVYITLLATKSGNYHAITNIGRNPTVEKRTTPVIETHAINQALRELYGERITLFFLKRIREEKKFSSVEELKEQIREDTLTAINYFAENNYPLSQCF